MKSFRSYIKEAVSIESNQHIWHIEDKMIVDGQDGLKKIIELFEEIINDFSGIKGKSLQMKFKFDGSPSVVFGINKENGEFFVGTKSVFNKLKPKINYTQEDINQNHEQEDLRRKLKYCLKYLPELGTKSILQGDLLFIKPDLKTQEIDGKKYLTFRPNTLIYAIPVDSDLAKEIKQAQLGIVLHTEYRGSSMKDLKSTLKINVTGLKHTKNIWWRDADFETKDKKLNVTKEDISLLKHDLEEIKKLAKDVDNTFLDKLENDVDVQNTIMQYENFLVRKNEYFRLNSKEKFNGLIQYVKDKFDGEISLRKTDVGRERRQQKQQYVIDTFVDNKQATLSFFKLQNAIVKLKQEVINKLNEIKTLSTFVDDQGKISPVDAEGIVAVTDNGVSKLVNRDIFSRLNFNIGRPWKDEENI